MTGPRPWTATEIALDHLQGIADNRDDWIFPPEKARLILAAIDDLKEERDRLIDGFLPVAKTADFYKPEVPHYEFVSVPLDILRHARAALAKAQGRG